MRIFLYFLLVHECKTSWVELQRMDTRLPSLKDAVTAPHIQDVTVLGQREERRNNVPAPGGWTVEYGK